MRNHADAVASGYRTTGTVATSLLTASCTGYYQPITCPTWLELAVFVSAAVCTYVVCVCYVCDLYTVQLAGVYYYSRSSGALYIYVQ